MRKNFSGNRKMHPGNDETRIHFRSDFNFSDTTGTEDYSNQWFKVERTKIQRTGTG
jgi:hypothetical protein